MIIKKVAIGNNEDAFIEDRFRNTVNIIYSNDNNKGKTIVFQGIMYALGNSPIFPSQFNYKDYFFYLKITHNEIEFEFLRKKNSIVVKEANNISVFDSISDFKIFFKDRIYDLPKIIKDSIPHISDLSMFYQLFFLPQDKRNTSNVINCAPYNKRDFMNMLKAIINREYINIDSTDEAEVKDRIKEIKREISILDKRIQFSKKNPNIAKQVLQYANDRKLEEKSRIFQEKNKEIGYLSVKRNREINRIYKLEALLNELHSLNRHIEVGKIKCADCGSTNIVYTNGDFSFDISNDLVRKQIINSITKQIQSKEELVTEYLVQINTLQNELQLSLIDLPPEVGDIIINRSEILNDQDNDKKIKLLKNELDLLHEKKKLIAETRDEIIDVVNRKIDSIIDLMKRIYIRIAELQNIEIVDLFTLNNENYSGSEGQMFYFAKLVSISKILDFNFPVIIDCFREGEISSKKEDIMLSELHSLNKQVIISATLKDQEYSEQKYASYKYVNSIDYSEMQSYKILKPELVSEFQTILATFGM